MPDVVPLKFAHDIDLLSPLNPLYVLDGGGIFNLDTFKYIYKPGHQSHMFLGRIWTAPILPFHYYLVFFFNLDTFKFIFAFLVTIVTYFREELDGSYITFPLLLGERRRYLISTLDSFWYKSTDLVTKVTCF